MAFYFNVSKVDKSWILTSFRMRHDRRTSAHRFRAYMMNGFKSCNLQIAYTEKRHTEAEYSFVVITNFIICHDVCDDRIHAIFFRDKFLPRRGM